MFWITVGLSSFEELEKRIRRLEERVKDLEEELDSLLTADDFRALKEAEEEYRRGETIACEELVKKPLEEIRYIILEELLSSWKIFPSILIGGFWSV